MLCPHDEPPRGEPLADTAGPERLNRPGWPGRTIPSVVRQPHPGI